MILPDFILVLKKGFTYGLVVVIYIVSIVANGHMENYINVSLSQQLRSTLCSELFETMQTRSLLQNYSHCLVVSLKHMSIFSKQLKEKGFFLQFFTRLKLQASKRKNVLNSGYRTVRGKVSQRNRVYQSMVLVYQMVAQNTMRNCAVKYGNLFYLCLHQRVL